MADQTERLAQEVEKDRKEAFDKLKVDVSKILNEEKGAGKARSQLNETMKKIAKSSGTLGYDLQQNVKAMGTTFQTTAEGMINETFGPLGGVVQTFTTGFFKRSKERKENELKAIALEEQAMAQAEAILNDKEQTDDTKEIKEHQEDTKKGVEKLVGGENTLHESLRILSEQLRAGLFGSPPYLETIAINTNSLIETDEQGRVLQNGIWQHLEDIRKDTEALPRIEESTEKISDGTETPEEKEERIKREKNKHKKTKTLRKREEQLPEEEEMKVVGGCP